MATVAELIEQLSKLEPNAKIYIDDYNQFFLTSYIGSNNQTVYGLDTKRTDCVDNYKIIKPF